MGASVSWLSNILWAKKEIRILILGLVRQHQPSPSGLPPPGNVLGKICKLRA